MTEDLIGIGGGIPWRLNEGRHENEGLPNNTTLPFLRLPECSIERTC